MFTKKALIRDPSVPIGQPAPMHLVCVCGQKVPVTSNENACACGITFDGRGWIVKR